MHTLANTHKILVHTQTMQSVWGFSWQLWRVICTKWILCLRARVWPVMLTHIHTHTDSHTVIISEIRPGQTGRRDKEQLKKHVSSDFICEAKHWLTSEDEDDAGVDKKITCAQWFLNTIMQVSGSTPLNVRDFFRCPPITTEAIILTDCQGAKAWSGSMRGGCLMEGLRVITWLPKPRISLWSRAWWAASR